MGDDDLLEVSGPVSVRAFDLPVEGGRMSARKQGGGAVCRVYIFGDEHFSYDNLCPGPCRGGRDVGATRATPLKATRTPTCSDIVGFVRGAVRDAEGETGGGDVDVFLELPYVVRAGPRRTAWLRTLEQFMSRDPDVLVAEARRSSRTGPRDGRKGKDLVRWILSGGGSRSSAAPGGAATAAAAAAAARTGDRLVADVARRVLGTAPSPRYVGVLSQLYREFRDELYDDDVKQQRATEAGSVRFHYCDARNEPHVNRLLPALDPERLHGVLGVTTVDRLREVLHAFLFAPDFAAECVRLFGPAEAAKLIVPEAVSKGGAHKIAKQFLSLRPGPLKDAVRRYLDDRVEEALRVARDDLGFDSGARMLRGDGPGDGGLPARQLWRTGLVEKAHERFYRACFPYVMSLGVHVVLMDAYLVCRLTRFCGLGGAGERGGGVGIVYVGDAHADYYAAFLRNYVGLEPVVDHPLRMDARGRAIRCVPLNF